VLAHSVRVRLPQRPSATQDQAVEVAPPLYSVARPRRQPSVLLRVPEVCNLFMVHPQLPILAPAVIPARTPTLHSPSMERCRWTLVRFRRMVFRQMMPARRNLCTAQYLSTAARSYRRNALFARTFENLCADNYVRLTYECAHASPAHRTCGAALAWLRVPSNQLAARAQ
jgi:hypothetical protein